MRSLSRRSVRSRTGEFLAEGPQAVREAVAFRPDLVRDVYVTAEAAERHAAIVAAAREADRWVHEVTPEVLAAMSDTESPQGIAAVCRVLDLPLADVLADLPTDALVCVLTNVRDPGNAGTVIRGADAAGADAVIVSDASVDVYNSKVVRSTVGSLWHVPLAVGSSVPEILQALRERGVRLLAADGAGTTLLHDADLTGAARLGDGQRGLGPPAGGARRLRRRRPGPHPRSRRVAQPRHGRDDLSLRLGGGSPHEPLTALCRRSVAILGP